MDDGWWLNRYEERFWLEVTGRSDLGANLKAPQTNEHGHEFWSYSLLNALNIGDIVFHYYRPDHAIVAVSTVSTEVWEDNLVWAARGISARQAGVQPHKRPGWYIGIENFTYLDTPLTLSEIRERQRELTESRAELARTVNQPLYFPFELSSKRPLRPMQGYMFKLPTFFVSGFSGLQSYLQGFERQYLRERNPEIGGEYRSADEEVSVGERDPFSIDPSLVERALHGHATTQNKLAAYVQSQGIEPRSPRPSEPNFDLAWTHGSSIWVAEVKSLSHSNEEKQLRLGLGQLLRYRYLLGGTNEVFAVLVLERAPSDHSWETLCNELGVILVHPGNWGNKLQFSG